MYAELHCKTNFSFLEGASHPDELVRRAAELGYRALAVTDRNSLAGIVRAHGAAKDVGLKLIVGAEITPSDAPPVVLWATDRAAYSRLTRLITLGRRRAPKGECQLRFADIAAHVEGLLAGVSPSCGAAVPAARAGETPAPQSYRDLFDNRLSLLAELHCGPDDRGKLQRLLELSRQTHIPLVAAGDVHYHSPDRAMLHDVLTAVRHNCTVADVTARLFSNAERHLKSPAEMATLFADAPNALRRTLEIAEQCTFSLDELRYEYPEELAPPGTTTSDYLAQLAWAGANARYPKGVPPKVRGLIEHELQLIAELHYEAYFLTVWDLVQFARRRGILCQGRGSAANSAVCFCLGITAVDPERMDVLFERFVSRERNEAPDIDVDFEHERREEVLQYLYEKYGRDRAGITGVTITYRPRSAVRDVGKALGMPPELIDRIAKNIEHSREDWKTLVCGQWSVDSGQKGERGERRGERGQGSGTPNLQINKSPNRPSPNPLPMGEETKRAHFLALVDQLLGFPRHLSQHTGGMVMTRGPLDELVPIENAAMPGRTVIEWNKDDLDELGILKVDCLALGMLTAVRRCFDLIARHYGRKLTLANVPEGDEDVYAMIRRADTMGVFQIESRAQMSMLPRLQPRCFYDLVIEVAIVRPGPIQGNMVHPYLRRRNGEEAVTYPNDAVRGVLEKTLGVPLFQEQAMRLAVVAAGFTPGEADQLRRAMGAWRRPGIIDKFRRKLIDGMRANGFSEEYAEAVFGQIRGFGDYGFPESHAASFALLVYVSAWLKCHYPAAFTASLLNSQPMGFYAPAQLVRNAREHNVDVLPVDVNRSDWECTLEEKQETKNGKIRTEERVSKSTDNSQFSICNSQFSIFSLRLGFNVLSGISSSDIERIVGTRQEGSFHSMDDFAQRTGLSRATISRLAKAGVFESLELNRRNALWEALAQDHKDLPLFDTPAIQHSSFIAHHSPAPLPPMSPAEEVLADYRTAGLSLRAHPMSFLRADLAKRNVVAAESLQTLPNGKLISVAGIVLVRQRPGTAKGITFVTLEDETGTANLIVRPAVWKRFRRAANEATVLLASGRLQRQGQVIHLLTTRLENLSTWLGQLGAQSRDFC